MNRLRGLKEIQVDASRLGADEIMAVSEELCVARTQDGVFAFSRVCPHAGADLSHGYVRDGKIHCAWHNLGFDPRTGGRPCKSIRGLNVFPLVEAGGGTYTLLTRRRRETP